VRRSRPASRCATRFGTPESPALRSLACPVCVERAAEAAAYVEAMRAAIITGNFDFGVRGFATEGAGGGADHEQRLPRASWIGAGASRPPPPNSWKRAARPVRTANATPCPRRRTYPQGRAQAAKPGVASHAAASALYYARGFGVERWHEPPFVATVASISIES
jgi:hypothetical protein